MELATCFATALPPFSPGFANRYETFSIIEILSAIHSSVKELQLRAGEMNENKCLIALTVNPLLSQVACLFKVLLGGS